MGNPSGLWNLEADPAVLDALANAWKSQIKQLSWAAETISRAASRVVGGCSWEGETAQRYDQHRHKVVADLDDCAELAGTVARALSECAQILRHNQELLTAEWQKLPTLDGSPGLRPPGLPTLSEQAIALAEEIRAEVDQELNARLTTINAAIRQLQGWEGKWAARTLRTLNWNIQQGGGGNNFWSRKPGTDPGDFGGLAQRIIDGKVDVATLQEVFQGGADELRRELNHRDPAGKWEVHFGKASDKYQWSNGGAPPVIGAEDEFGNAVVVRTGSGVTTGPTTNHSLGKGDEDRGVLQVPINVG